MSQPDVFQISENYRYVVEMNGSILCECEHKLQADMIVKAVQVYSPSTSLLHTPQELASMIRQLKADLSAANQHIHQLEKERDSLIQAIRALPLPDKPKPNPVRDPLDI